MMLAHGNMRVSHVSTHMALEDVPKRLTPERLRRVIDLTHDGADAARRRRAADRDRGAQSACRRGRPVRPAGYRHLRRRSIAEGGRATGSTWSARCRATRCSSSCAPASTMRWSRCITTRGTSRSSCSASRSIRRPARGRISRGVNITLGLPIIRTSVDHGTAFDIAGKGIANEHSLIEAIEYAERLAAARRRMPQSSEIAPMTNAAHAASKSLRPAVIEFGTGTIAAAVALGRRARSAPSGRWWFPIPSMPRRVDMLGLPGAVEGVRRRQARAGRAQSREGGRRSRERRRARSRRRLRRRQRDGPGQAGRGAARRAARRSRHRRAGEGAGRRVALMQVPTTSGTGSEAGTRALVTDPGDAEQARGAEPLHAGRYRHRRSRSDDDRAAGRSPPQPASMRWRIASRPTPAARRIR